jgi:spermidine/putrescine transport system permease protein
MLLFTSTVVPMGINLGFFTVILAHISFGVPYAIIAIYPRMQKMNMNLIYAAEDCGYNKFQTFMKVIIPYLMPAIITGATIAIAMSMDDFVITNLTNGSFQTIGTAIYSTRKGIKAWVVTFGAIIVLITIAVIVYKSIAQTIKDRINNKNKIKRRLR